MTPSTRERKTEEKRKKQKTKKDKDKHRDIHSPGQKHEDRTKTRTKEE